MPKNIVQCKSAKGDYTNIIRIMLFLSLAFVFISHNAQAQPVLSIDGSSTSPQTFASNTMHTYTIASTAATSGNFFAIEWCTNPGWTSCSVSYSCQSSCEGELTGTGSNPSSFYDCFQNTGATTSTSYVGVYDTSDPAESSTQITVNINTGNACNGSGGPATTLTIDGSGSPTQTYASGSTLAYEVSGGTSGDAVGIVYCPYSTYSQTYCSTPSSGCAVNTPPGCSGLFSAGNPGGTFATSDCVYSSTGGSNIYVGYTVNGAQAGSLIQVVLTGTATCGSGGTSVSTSYGATGSIVQPICQIYFDINTVLFLLALALMVLGGAIYGGANLLPGQQRGGVQAYAMGLIIGGIVGSIIGILAPWVVGTVTSMNVTNALISTCPQFG